jgi:hypothetical protein
MNIDIEAIKKSVDEFKLKAAERRCPPEKIVIDETNNYKATVDFDGTCMYLGFYDKNGYSIQGKVDETLGFDDVETEIEGLTMTPDDGSFIVGLTDYPKEKIKDVKQPLMQFFSKLYFDNKKRFAKNIKKDL